MINKSIIDYIKAQNQKGQNKEEIKKALTSAGWQIADINEAFRCAESNIPFPPSTPDKLSDFFQEEQSGLSMTTLLSATDLLKKALKFFKAKISTLVGITLIPITGTIALIMMAVAIATGAGFFNLIAKNTVGGAPDSSPFLYIFIIIMFILLILAIIILQIWSQIALIIIIKNNNENIGVAEAYKRGWRKLGSFFWVGLLSGIIILGGYLFFIIPGIIFGVWFSFAVYIVIVEGMSGMNAILKSKEYVAGYWWEVFWRFVFIGLVIFGLNIVAMILGLIIPVLPNLLMIFVAPLTVIYSFLVYKNLKAIKETKSEIKSEFSSGEKIKFIAVGVFGILLISGIFALPIIMYMLNFGHF